MFLKEPRLISSVNAVKVTDSRFTAISYLIYCQFNVTSGWCKSR